MSLKVKEANKVNGHSYSTTDLSFGNLEEKDTGFLVVKIKVICSLNAFNLLL